MSHATGPRPAGTVRWVLSVGRVALAIVGAFALQAMGVGWPLVMVLALVAAALTTLIVRRS
jgi:hypothetical protein